MLLGKKTNNERLNDWCVILNPIESELNKAEAVEKIVEIFPISIEEASQLVERTPIILLENISYEKAKQIKDFFISINAEILLTNDEFLRRKCYRTVWPSDPMKKIPGLEDSTQGILDKGELIEEELLSKESAIKLNKPNLSKSGSEILATIISS